MSETVNILAAGVSDLIEVGMIVLILLIMVVAKIIGVILQKKMRRREQERIEQARREGGAGEADLPGPPARQQPAGIEEIARQVRDIMGLPQEQPPARPEPPADQPPVRLAPPASVRLANAPEEVPPVRVDDELRRDRQRMRKTEAQRRRRLTFEAPLEADTEADTEAIAARLVSIRPEAIAWAGPSEPEPTAIVDLGGVDQARRAMMYYEIFSSPKALRQRPEMWEL